MEHSRAHRVCYFDLLGSNVDARGKPWRGTQNVFVSHSWGTPFVNLLDTIEAFQADRVGEQYYYIDLFCLNQHNLAELEGRVLLYDANAAANKAEQEEVAAILLETLDRAVATARCTLVAINAYDGAAPLARIWCLYEIWRASSVFEKPTIMGFPLHEARRFKQAVNDLKVGDLSSRGWVATTIVRHCPCANPFAGGHRRARERQRRRAKGRGHGARGPVDDLPNLTPYGAMTCAAASGWGRSLRAARASRSCGTRAWCSSRLGRASWRGLR